MHPDELATDEGLVRRLLAAPFPQWADLLHSGHSRQNGWLAQNGSHPAIRLQARSAKDSPSSRAFSGVVAFWISWSRSAISHDQVMRRA